MVTSWPSIIAAVAVVILVQLQMLLDCCDGEVARWRRTSSPTGVYLDRVGHYVAECGIAVALGIRAAGESQLSGVWISAGLLLGLLVALNKVENDLVHVSRHYAGLPQMRTIENVRKPMASSSRGGVLLSARRVARFVPFHRVFHSVELSLLILVAAVVDLFVDGTATRALLVGSGGSRGPHGGRPPGGRLELIAAAVTGAANRRRRGAHPWASGRMIFARLWSRYSPRPGWSSTSSWSAMAGRRSAYPTACGLWPCPRTWGSRLGATPGCHW